MPLPPRIEMKPISSSSSSSITADEAEVADILDRLPELVNEFCNGELSLALHWGTKKRRTVPDGAQQQSDKTRSAASSPTTPLSYSGSGADGVAAAPAVLDPKAHPGHAPGKQQSAQPASFKNAKRHKEWVKEQSQTIATMSAYNVNLERALSEAKRRYQTLMAKNSSLKEMRSKMILLQSQSQAQSRPVVQLQWRNAPAVPTETAFPMAQPMATVMGNAWWRPPQVGSGASVVTAEGSRVVPDLNASVEEEAVGLELGLGIGTQQQQQRNAWKAAMSAQARKRRMEIKRERSHNNNAALKQPHMR